MSTLLSFFRWLKYGLMSIIFPAHMKRLMFMVTLYHYIKKDPTDVESVDKRALDELNESLHLAKTNAQSLVLPGLMTQSIWANCPEEALLTCPLDHAVDCIINTIPSWLVYGSKERIRDDVNEMRQFVLKQTTA